MADDGTAMARTVGPSVDLVGGHAGAELTSHGPGKDVMALPFDEAFDEYNAERLRAADTLLLGRTSFEGFKSYWPSVADNPDVRPVEREISRRNNAIDKVVISDGLTADQTAPWRNTRIIKRQDAHKEVAQLKTKRGAEILVLGSH